MAIEEPSPLAFRQTTFAKAFCLFPQWHHEMAGDSTCLTGNTAVWQPPVMMKKPRESTKMAKVTIRLPDPLVERAKIRAIRERRTFQDVLTEALERFLRAAKEGAR